MDLRFDEYVSLGSTCECAFQFRRVLGRDSSSFFSWNNTGIEALRRLLEKRFEGAALRENLAVHRRGIMLNDTAYGYLFHNPFDRADFLNDPAFDQKLADHQSKISYLAQKFLRQRPPGHRTAYFCRVEEGTAPGAAREAAAAIADLLSRIHVESDFVLVILQLAEHREDAWPCPHVYNRYLRRFAPLTDATDGHVLSWDRLFQEFPHKEPMQLSGF